jgi:hypothetical protein
MIGVILIVFVACFLLERAAPGSRLPSVRTWPLRFGGDKEERLGAMLMFQDVHKDSD